MNIAGGVPHLARLAASPRPTGGAAIDEARVYCAIELRRLGFVVREEPFEYSAFAGRFGAPSFGLLLPAAATLAVVVANRGSADVPWLAIVVIGLAIAVAIGLARGVLERSGHATSRREHRSDSRPVADETLARRASRLEIPARPDARAGRRRRRAGGRPRRRRAVAARTPECRGRGARRGVGRRTAADVVRRRPAERGSARQRERRGGCIGRRGRALSGASDRRADHRRRGAFARRRAGVGAVADAPASRSTATASTTTARSRRCSRDVAHRGFCRRSPKRPPPRKKTCESGACCRESSPTASRSPTPAGRR